MKQTPPLLISGILLALFLSACQSVTRVTSVPANNSTQIPETQKTTAPTSRLTEIATVSPSTSILPDLVILYHSVIYTGDCAWGGPGRIKVWVKNIGEVDTGSFDVEINGKFTRISALPAGQEIAGEVAFESGPIGSIIAHADPTNLIIEADEDNNEFHIIFTPPPSCTPEGS